MGIWSLSIRRFQRKSASQRYYFALMIYNLPVLYVYRLILPKIQTIYLPTFLFTYLMNFKWLDQNFASDLTETLAYSGRKVLDSRHGFGNCFLGILLGLFVD